MHPERDALAEVLAGEDKPCRKALAANPGGCVGEYGWCLCRKTADAILASDWLAQRDRRVRAEVLREAAESADDRWCDEVVDEVSGWLREHADRIERGE